MSDKLLSFDDVLERTKQGNRFLLLGNGFSMAYDKARFSFTSLLESAVDKKIIEIDSPVYNLFQNLETSDFEYVMKLLEDAQRVVDCYLAGNNLKDLKDRLSKDATSLKEYLVKIITNNHPDKITEIPDDRFINTLNFLNCFSKVYSLNYDLLLYWSAIKSNERGLRKEQFTDGFGYVSKDNADLVFKNKGISSIQTLFHLHGGLHLYDNGHEFQKLKYDIGHALKDQVLEKLNNNIYPVFVSEGTSDSKKKKIIHNAYLNHAYKSLKSIGSSKSNSDSIIFFGTTLKTNDDHILEAILENKVKNIYIGINPNKMMEMDSLRIRFESDKKSVFFYDYTTVKLW
jgi:hypothetical protein